MSVKISHCVTLFQIFSAMLTHHITHRTRPLQKSDQPLEFIELVTFTLVGEQYCLDTPGPGPHS